MSDAFVNRFSHDPQLEGSCPREPDISRLDPCDQSQGTALGDTVNSPGTDRGIQTNANILGERRTWINVSLVVRGARSKVVERRCEKWIKPLITFYWCSF